MLKYALMPLLSLLLLIATPAFAAQDSAVTVGDEVLVIVPYLNVVTEPQPDGAIAAEMLKGMKSRIIAEQTDAQGNRWFYLVDNAYSWVPEFLDGSPTLALYSDAAVQNLISDATSALQTNPDDIEAYVQRATAELTLRQYEAALADYSAAIELDGEDGRLYEYRGKVYLDTDDPRAVSDFMTAINLGRTLSNTYNRIAIAYADFGSNFQAIEYYDLAIEANPAYGLIYSNRANAMSIPDNFNMYAEAIDIDPYLATAYANRGLHYKNMGNYDDALADFNMALEINPYCSFCYRFRGNLYGEVYLDFTQALADHELAVTYDPYDSRAFMSRGIAYTMLGNTYVAISDYKRALELDSTNENAAYNLGALYGHLGKYNSAESTYTAVLEINGHFNVAPFLYRAQIYIALEEYDKAHEDLTSYLARMTYDGSDSHRFFRATTYIGLATVNLHQGDYDTAITNYANAFNDHAEFARNFANYGRGYWVTDLREQEISGLLLEASAASDADVYLDAALLALEFGHWQEGLDAFQHYLDLTDNPPEGAENFIAEMQQIIGLER